MSEKEKDIIRTIAAAVPKMSERDKGYFLGYAEALASKSEGQERSSEPTSQEEAGKKLG